MTWLSSYKRLFIVALASLLAGAGPARSAEPPAGGKAALVVGVNKYRNFKAIDRDGNLNFAEHDAEEVAKVLRAGGFPTEEVTVLTTAAGGRLEPTAANVRERLRALAGNATETDTLWVSFAGYEYQFVGSDEYYLCPTDANKADKETLISLNEIYEALARAKAKHKVVVIDSCRSLEREGKAKAQKAPPRGVVVLFACSAGESASEDPALQQGILSYYLCEALRGRTDTDRGGKITWPELVAYVKERVPVYAKEKLGENQHPVVLGETPSFVVTTPK